MVINHNSEKNPKLVLGPCFFNWSTAEWKSFYLRMAHTSVEEVYLGEVVCHRRDHFFRDALEEVTEALEKAGKKVIFSTISLVLGQPELLRAQEIIKDHPNHLIEVNDISVLSALRGRPFVVGPTINNYNENTTQLLESLGAQRFCLPYELDQHTIGHLAASTNKEIEVFAFGRTPLAISARCYHARLHKKPKIDCEYVCNLDYNAKDVTTLSNEEFLAVNGTQTMSTTYCNLILELAKLSSLGASVFRLSPHFLDMEEVIATFRAVLDAKIEAAAGFSRLLRILPSGAKFSNGFFYGGSGKDFQQQLAE